MHSPQSTNFAFHYEVRWHRNVCGDRFSIFCRVQPETQFVRTHLRVDTTRASSVGAAERGHNLTSNSHLRLRFWIFTRGYLLMSFPQGDISARQRGFDIRVFPFLVELQEAIEPHLPVSRSYRWQPSHNKWSSPTTKSLDFIVVTALQLGLPGGSLGPASSELAFSCPMPEELTTEASGQLMFSNDIILGCT